jgi:hypothetical protein
MVVTALVLHLTPIVVSRKARKTNAKSNLFR